MGGDKMSHSPYLDSCNMIEKSFFSDNNSSLIIQ